MILKGRMEAEVPATCMRLWVSHSTGRKTMKKDRTGKKH